MKKIPAKNFYIVRSSDFIIILIWNNFIVNFSSQKPRNNFLIKNFLAWYVGKNLPVEACGIF